MDRKRRQALQAQSDDIADQSNEFGPGIPDGARRRPKRPQGNSRACILRRLRHYHPELHKLVLNGTLSPHRAAISAGFRKPPGPRPKRRPVDPGEIGPDQEQELWLGPADKSLFADDAERRELWLRHREKIMSLWGQHGRRPQAWWLYESGGLNYPGYDLERSTLFEAGLLSESEVKELTANWRAGFDRLLDPDVFGDLSACEAHIEWCDMPRSLLTTWSTEAIQRSENDKKEPHSASAEGLQSA